MEKKVKIVSTIYFIVVAIIVFTSDNVKLFATALDYIACGSATGIPKPIPQVITIAYTLLMVGAPIVLVVSSVMTLIKAVADNDLENISKARNKLFKKFAMAVLIFLTTSIVRFVIGKVASTTNDKNTVTQCLNCFVYYSSENCQASSSGNDTETETYTDPYSNIEQAESSTGKPKGTKTILIGDSRTVGICGSTSRSAVTDCRDGVVAVRQGAASNQGGCTLCNWFDNEAIPAVNRYLDSHSDTIFNIVILMGVNDLGLTPEKASDNYIADLQRLSNGAWRKHSIVFVSAGPVRDEHTYVGQSKIDEFNRLMAAKIKKKNFRNVTYCDIKNKVHWVFGNPGDGVHYYGRWINGYSEGSTNYFNGVMKNCV